MPTVAWKSLGGSVVRDSHINLQPYRREGLVRSYSCTVDQITRAWIFWGGAASLPTVFEALSCLGGQTVVTRSWENCGRKVWALWTIVWGLLLSIGLVVEDFSMLTKVVSCWDFTICQSPDTDFVPQTHWGRLVHTPCLFFFWLLAGGHVDVWICWIPWSSGPMNTRNHDCCMIFQLSEWATKASVFFFTHAFFGVYFLTWNSQVFGLSFSHWWR